ncbi:hypothetical protein M422DRAFT_779197 [Sphaerobolus stellatus SS14]|uniref:Uncharacterized protein n=1 Tax=Sphaerobolus stellatus (strain SS14) TaxID=990650 RepID=A0A0C9URS1_SPHS4|nr:hypothetical protein M422DRAFT_784663 [Sphaerobolus stellatus SS14]KIJ44868.1 hypothetical protein M422DRAFT_779197 [Sphaerobolus stellatus SS14]
MPTAPIDPLLPANTEKYKATVQNAASKEGLVNGVWNAILNRRFPTDGLAWTINPEYHTQGGYPDFLVIHMENSGAYGAWTVLYEGKDASGDSFEKILTQLGGYTKDLKAGKFVYFIGAKGRACAFWKFTKGNSQETQQMSVKDKKVQLQNVTTAKQYDLVQDQTSISIILAYILDNLPTS